jgi:hypothetical protein
MSLLRKYCTVHYLFRKYCTVHYSGPLLITYITYCHPSPPSNSCRPVKGKSLNEDGSLSEQNIHDLYTQIPKCKVEELYSKNAAYRWEWYLSIERFSIQTLKPLGEGEFSQVYCAHRPVGNRVITLKVLSKDENPLICVREEIQI